MITTHSRNINYILWTVHSYTHTWERPTRCTLFLNNLFHLNYLEKLCILLVFLTYKLHLQTQPIFMPAKYNTQIRRPLIPKAVNSLKQYTYFQMYMTVTVKNCHIIQNLCSCFSFNVFNFHWKIYLVQFYLFTQCFILDKKFWYFLPL